MSKTKSSGLVRSAIGREAEVEELYALVKSGKSIYVYGMPSSGVEKIIADVCYTLRKGNVLEINVSMCSIGEGKHTENGIATLILDECGESYREPITMSAVVRALREKIEKGQRVIFRVNHFDEIIKEEDARIFCRLIELADNELNGKVSFVLSGYRTPQSKIFTGVGVGVQLGELEHYPIEPFRGCRVQQYLETMYGMNSIDERKLSRIIEATSGDPLLIERLAKLGFETDWRIALCENEKFQREIMNFVRQVATRYGDEVLFDGETTVKDVWRGKEVVGYYDELSAIGVLPYGEYKLPGIFAAYIMVVLPPSPSSRKVVDEVTVGSPLERDGKKKRDGAGGESQLDEGDICDVEKGDVRGVLKLIKRRCNGKKQLLQVEYNGRITCGYKITNANNWRLIDRLVKENRKFAAYANKEGWMQYQLKEVAGLANGHGSKGGFEDGIYYKGARDFWDECMNHKTEMGIPVACIPKRKI